MAAPMPIPYVEEAARLFFFSLHVTAHGLKDILQAVMRPSASVPTEGGSACP